MVSYAGKELLKNSINTANFHNRIREEKLTWRQFELEKGLTMMVSDDIIRKRHLCKHHAEKRKREQEKEIERRREKQIAKLEKAKSRAEALEKWDHSGFEELYPNIKSDGEKPRQMQKMPTKKSKKKQFSRSRSPPSKKKRKIYRSDVDKWDHSGYRKLYPDVPKKRSSSQSSSSTLSLSPSPTSSSYSDIRSRSSRRSLRRSSSSSSSSTVSSSLSSSPTTSSSSDYEQTRREIKKIYGRGSSSSSKGDLQTSRSRSRQKKSRHQC